MPGLPGIKPRFERIARFAPLIGLFIGLVQGILWFVLSKFDWPKEALALLSLGVGILITGGLHLDGLMDTADGLAAGKKKCIEAMQDSRVGAAGVQAMALILLIQLSALIKLDSLAPVAIPIATFWGRCAPFWAIEKFSYLHRDGSAAFHQLHWKRWKDLIPTFLILFMTYSILYFAPSTLMQRIPLIFGISLGILPAFLVPDLLGKRLGGHSGDSYGASLVISETFMLLALAIILQ